VMNEAGILDDKQTEQTGFGIGTSTEKKAVAPANTPMTKLDELNEKLSDAITKEDYEKAARIRDEISKLQSRS
jgi:uncharacterized protein